jgi:hypothetical protein
MITSLTQTRFGTTTVITAQSSLTAATYYWYIDGNYVGAGSSTTRTFVLASGDQARIDVLDSVDPNFDPIANAPQQFPAVRTLVFPRSMSSTIARYRIEQQINGGAWTVLGLVQDDPRAWLYSFVTMRLTDLTSYAWRCVPMGASGNDGTPIALTAEQVVRTPDAPGFTAAFQAGSGQVLFSAA